MVEWVQRKLMDFGFSIDLFKKTASTELTMSPQDGESDQEFLMRLILTPSPK